jgi:hypothetical protein
MILNWAWKNESTLRKRRSIEILKTQEIPFISWLPEIEDTNTSLRRSTEEVSYRAMALCVVAEKAEGLEKQIVDKIITDCRLDGYFTEKEQQFINDQKSDEVTKIQFLWRYEAYWVLLWALGFINKLDYPDKICDVPLAVSFLSERSASEFIQEAKLRGQDEILNEADLIYRYHWAVINNKLKAIEPPGGLDRSIVYERHYALNWLIGYGKSGWDEISTDT